MIKFDVTYAIVTPESAEHGDAEERGFISEDVGLREAIDDVNDTRTSLVDGVQAINADSYPWRDGQFSWITIINGMEFETGARESRSLHIPDTVTPSSKLRIARLLGAQ